MITIRGLDVGDRMSLNYEGREYHTVVQDIPEPGVLVIAQPTSMGIPLTLLPGARASVYFVRENGVLTFQAEDDGSFFSDNVPMMRLRAVSPVRRSQRRNYYRLNKSLPVQVSVKDETQADNGSLTIKARTINISGGGCRIAIRQPLDDKTKLECKITLAPNFDLVLDGQVIYVEKHSGAERSNVIGVQFTDEDSGTQKKLVGYVTDEQRKLLKKETGK